VASDSAASTGAEPRVQAHAMWAGVLRFLGCTAYAHEEAQLVGGDDLAFLQTFADVDLASKPAMLARALAGLARGTGARNRLRALAAFLSDPHAGNAVSSAHCQLGEQLARDLAMPTEVCAALAQMYERWDGRGCCSRWRAASRTSRSRASGACRLAPCRRTWSIASTRPARARAAPPPSSPRGMGWCRCAAHRPSES
jgi:hypothetical protein